MNTPQTQPTFQLDLFGSEQILRQPERVPCPTCSGCGTVSPAEALAHSPGKVSAAHPATSEKAARQASNRVRFGTQRHKCLTVLAARPMTAAEVAERIGVSRNQTATRLLELRESGLTCYLVVNGERVTRPTGNRDEGQVHQITEAGRAVLKGLTQ